jgi:putative transposase
MKLDIKFEMKNIILKSKSFKDTFNKKHPNTKYSLNLIIDELFYVLVSGVSWRMVRSPINYKTLYYYYSKFVHHNIFYKLFIRIRNKYIKRYINKNDMCIAYIDSTVINNKGGINKVGRNKFYKNKKSTKISLLTDKNGIPLSVFFIKGNYHDTTVFDKHIKDIPLIMSNNIKVIADKAYASRKNYSLLESRNMKHIIPPRKNMKIKNTYVYDKNEYIKRIKIEHIFSKLKIYKRINNRYDKLLRNYIGFVYLALAVIISHIILKL